VAKACEEVCQPHELYFILYTVFVSPVKKSVSLTSFTSYFILNSSRLWRSLSASRALLHTLYFIRLACEEVCQPHELYFILYTVFVSPVKKSVTLTSFTLYFILYSSRLWRSLSASRALLYTLYFIRLACEEVCQPHELYFILYTLFVSPVKKSVSLTSFTLYFILYSSRLW